MKDSTLNNRTKKNHKSNKRFIPSTPGGSLLMHLEAKTEDAAWNNLLEDAPYPSIEALKKRGYTVTPLKG